VDGNECAAPTPPPLPRIEVDPARVAVSGISLGGMAGRFRI